MALRALLFVVLALSACSIPPRAQDDDPVYGEDSLIFGDFEDPWSRQDEPRSWWQARVDDFLQAFTLRLGLGPGLGARLSATKLVQAGMLVQGPSEPFGEILRLETVQLGNSGTEVGAWDVHSVEYGLSLWYSYEEDVFGYYDPSLPWHDAYEDRSSTAFEAAVHLGLIGAVAGVDPVGVGRFLLGVLGFGDEGWFDGEDSAPDEDLLEVGRR